MANAYYKSNIESRIKINLSSVRRCNLKLIDTLEDRDVMMDKMKTKLISIHGDTPKTGKWVAWNSCGCNAHRDGSREFCVNTDHWFLFNNACPDEKKQYRKLKTDGIIRNLTVHHQRYLDASTSGNHNTKRKIKCKYCNTKVSQNNIDKHERTCEKLKIFKQHTDVIEKLSNSSLSDKDCLDKLKPFIKKSISAYLEKTLPSKEVRATLANQYSSLIDEKTNNQTTISHLEAINENIMNRYTGAIERIKMLESSLNEEKAKREGLSKEFLTIEKRKRNLETFAGSIIDAYKSIVLEK